MTYSVVDVRNVDKVYGKKNENKYRALQDISFSIHEGEFIGIMGASGSGKTTLLNVISTLDKVTQGDIEIAGTNITAMNQDALAEFRAQKLGFIFQDFNLLESMTVYENIALPLFLQNITGKKGKERVENVADILDIKDILDKYPAIISGGQKQRTAAARALVHDPNIILADEPTGALDSNNAASLLETLKQLNEDHNVSIMMVTHDALSASYCQRILFLEDGDLYKEIQRTGTREEFFKEILDELAEAGKKKL
ncbi:putative ABC transport system ATP-binding protein [Salibacterium salarium]|uniref:ABC transporter ATP-binding protein n=1 Tax=Salibacterium salarium TaxID=284579 RepID=UPI0027823432|nr:ABC transporter ATP-binding protein [Salibacterium salarium]MDQ0300223.1 putative ABC transport system ATP-binding protein [Salibacterium salarium]